MLFCTQGCAIAVGFTAASHLDAVLSKLDSMSKYEGGKKSTGFFGFIKVSIGVETAFAV